VTKHQGPPRRISLSHRISSQLITSHRRGRAGEHDNRTRFPRCTIKGHRGTKKKRQSRKKKSPNEPPQSAHISTSEVSRAGKEAPGSDRPPLCSVCKRTEGPRQRLFAGVRRFSLLIVLPGLLLWMVADGGISRSWESASCCPKMGSGLLTGLDWSRWVWLRRCLPKLCGILQTSPNACACQGDPDGGRYGPDTRSLGVRLIAEDCICNCLLSECTASRITE
jgi:hypothetical protein